MRSQQMLWLVEQRPKHPDLGPLQWSAASLTPVYKNLTTAMNAVQRRCCNPVLSAQWEWRLVGFRREDEVRP